MSEIKTSSGIEQSTARPTAVTEVIFTYEMAGNFIANATKTIRINNV